MDTCNDGTLEKSLAKDLILYQMFHQLTAAFFSGGCCRNVW